MIDILLSACNGSAYVTQQLESILEQSERNWHLFVRDDGSEDETSCILESFASRFPAKVTILRDDLGRLGVVGNFSRLLDACNSRYIMFCDQDDVWQSDKISKTFQAMLAAEQTFGANAPLLVHTDLSVVDRDLRIIAPSFRRYQRLDPHLAGHPSRLMTQNVVAGCTVMINRALADLASPVPCEAVMHDWWLALVASLFGRVVYLDEPLILYRQHGSNSVGTSGWGGRGVVGKVRDIQRVRATMVQTVWQAQALLGHLGGRMTPEQRDIVGAYASLLGMGCFPRVWTILKDRFFKKGTIRNAGYLLNMFFCRRHKPN